ncbi:MAG: class I SAM-dependent methyltransferase, partial [Gammaproteobacteria bacterium]|nr:class I SAM-dependent methyltransferase [Gammaproteobacteria bacterium]
MDVPSRLPDPSPPELALSAELRLRIVNEIKANDGFLPFDRYMSLALFEPGLGYYMNGSRKFGAEGDFVTAPEISPLFGRTLARQWRSVSAYGDTIIEFGGGTGRLAASVLEALAAEDALPARYLIVE